MNFLDFASGFRLTLPTGDQIVIGSTLLYLGLPVAIFLIGWLNPWVAIPAVGLLLLGTVLTMKSFNYHSTSEYIRKNYLIAVLLGAAIWVMLSGIGGYGHQNVDFHFRNAVFHDLINHTWPVVYDYSTDPQLSTLFGGNGMLVYYFGFWLPSAGIGKLFGWGWANFALYLWTVTGVVLTLVLLGRSLKRFSWQVALIFVFASGMDFVGYWIANPVAPQGFTFVHQFWTLIVNTVHLDDWLPFNIQYSSMTTQLFWVFNQALPAWLGTLLLLEVKNIKSILFLWALILFFAPLPAIGLIPFVGYQAISRSDKRVRNAFRVKEFFSIQNLLCAGFLIMMFIAFFGQTAGRHKNGFLWSTGDLPGNWIALLAIFYFLEFLLFGFLLYKRKADNHLLILTLATLSLIPIFTYGRFNDFGMRASIPPLLILLLLAIRTYFDHPEDHPLFRAPFIRGALLVLFIIGALTPIHEMHRSISNILDSGGFPKMKDQWKTFDHALDPQDMPEMGNFVTGILDNSFFYTFLMKR